MDLGLKPRPDSETWAPNPYAAIMPTSFCAVSFHYFVSNLDFAFFLPFFKNCPLLSPGHALCPVASLVC